MLRPFFKVFLLSSAIALPILSTNAYGQTSSEQEESAIISYEKEFFIKYEPVTLLDMLQRVPGVQEILNMNRQQRRGGRGASSRGARGFGSGGDQILINGKRLAGKANSIDDTLGRISSDQVEKIDLIRGAAGGLDVQSQGLVINIILKEGSSTSTTFWKINGKYNTGHQFIPEFLISHSGSLNDFEYIISVERSANNFHVDRDEIFFNKLDQQTGERDVNANFLFRGYKFNTNLIYNFNDGSILRLNGLFEPLDMDAKEDRIETGDDPQIIFWDTDQDADKWEVGGDYTRNFEVLGRFKMLFVINQEQEERIVDRFIGAGANKFQNVREIEIEDKREKILRTSFTKNIFKSHSLELGGEVAINNFDKKFDNFNRDTAIDELLVKNSDNVEVTETRFEVFANHTYNISSKIVLQSSLTWEFSEIDADNIFVDGSISTLVNNFSFLKPRINLRYDVTNQDQLRLIIEKKVSQLNFNNFATRFDQRTEEIRIGNTNIRPEQVWEFSLAYEHRLPNDAGALEAEIFYRDYKDHISRVDFTEYQNLAGTPLDVEEFFALSSAEILTIRDLNLIDFTSKSGNIDSANAYGIKLKSNLRLGFIGLPQATLSLGYTYDRRRTTDQFTGLERNFDFASDHIYTLNYRHDVTQWRMSYGFDGAIRSNNASNNTSLFFPGSPAPSLAVFGEYTIFKGIKARIEAKQLAGRRGTSRIFNFNDHRRFDDLSERQDRISHTPREFEISIQGTF